MLAYSRSVPAWTLCKGDTILLSGERRKVAADYEEVGGLITHTPGDVRQARGHDDITRLTPVQRISAGI